MCASPAGESLINSELLRYLTDSKDEKEGKTEKKEEEGMELQDGTGGRGCLDKEPYVLYLGTNGLAGGGLKGRFMGRTLPP